MQHSIHLKLEGCRERKQVENEDGLTGVAGYGSSVIKKEKLGQNFRIGSQIPKKVHAEEVMMAGEEQVVCLQKKGGLRNKGPREICFFNFFFLLPFFIFSYWNLSIFVSWREVTPVTVANTLM